MSLSRFFPCFQFRLDDNVHKLDYSNNVLSEGFPQVWQHERTLEELNVTSTRINYLPPQLFYCQGLKVLLASSNNLENIPEAIGTLRQLHQLNLSRNFISYVPDNIKSCKNLTYLDLSCNSLRKLPDAITCLISLQELILNETYLEFLPANFGRLVNLRIVELRSNNLVSLPKSMQRLTNLQRLDIGCNEFIKMPDVIGDLKQLRELWFDSNQIRSLPIQTGKLRELIHFEANGNCLNFLPNEIGSWHNLEVFSVSINNLISLPFSIGMLKSLVTLKCEANELTELPTCISSLENLEELVVSYNRLVSLPSTIGMLRKLRYLFADNNFLHKLPDEICSCSALTIVSVSSNKLSALPDNLGHLTNLKVLNIVQNNIETLPVSLLSLVNLMSLWISNNQSQPLIPLQYTEVLKKTQLTCFMLPQLSNKQKDLVENNMATESNYATQFEDLAHKASACSISKRRICFAEEATILHNDQPPPNLLSNYSRNDNSVAFSHVNCPQTTSLTQFCENNDISDEKPNRKNYLMRSPTPYPKQLRMLAKYVQLNQQKPLSGSGDKSLQQIPTSKHNINNTHGSYMESSIHSNYQRTVDVNINENGNLYSTFGVDTNSDRFSVEHQCEVVTNDNERSMCSELPSDSNPEFSMVHNSLKPPPYHIARYFTKKSVDDLSKYDVTRKQQEHHQYSQSSENFDGSLLLQKAETDLDNQTILKSNLNFENPYNSTIHQIEPSKELKNSVASEEMENSEIAWRSQFFHVAASSPESGSYLAKQKVNKAKTKWLFGVHKNPRVLQVNVSLENGVEFEINCLPNREGIFVVSTASGSKASQLLNPFDKLLEVDGIDFTDIGLQEARHILQNSRPSVAIMLSRK